MILLIDIIMMLQRNYYSLIHIISFADICFHIFFNVIRVISGVAPMRQGRVPPNPILT